MWRGPACQTLSKALDISSTTAWVAPDLLKALANLSDMTVRRSAVDQEDLNTYWKSEKRAHFSRWSTILLFISFSKTLLSTEIKSLGTKMFFSVITKNLNRNFNSLWGVHKKPVYSGGIALKWERAWIACRFKEGVWWKGEGAFEVGVIP